MLNKVKDAIKGVKDRWWRIKSLSGTLFHFSPVFEVSREDSSFIETRYIDVRMGQDPTLHRFNYLDLYMFFYFCSSEEMKRTLDARAARNISYVPYDVTFQLDEKEKATGQAKRRIQLPVDEITMAMARAQANDLTKRRILGTKGRNP